MARDLSCGVEFMRGVLMFLNILFVIVGLALTGIGIYIKVDNNFASILNDLADNNSNFSGQSLGFLAFVMIGGGVVTLLIALFGCVGALWVNRCLLYMYAVILLILMIIELAGFIMAWVYKSKLKDVYTVSLKKVFDDGLQTNNTKIIDSFRELEKAMQCCGVQNVSDYGVPPKFPLSGPCEKVPQPTGCAAAITLFLSKQLPFIGITLGAVILLELLGLIAAIALAVARAHAPDTTYNRNVGQVLGGIVPRRRY